MNKIQELVVLDDHFIKLTFNDGTAKTIDFKPFIGDDVLTGSLADPDYFQKVKAYSNGRGIYWPNDYDFCPDYLHDYVTSVELA